jgi:hypothetical protein
MGAESDEVLQSAISNERIVFPALRGGNNMGAPVRRGALVGCALVSLEHKPQSELDLT